MIVRSCFPIRYRLYGVAKMGCLDFSVGYLIEYRSHVNLARLRNTNIDPSSYVDVMALVPLRKITSSHDLFSCSRKNLSTTKLYLSHRYHFLLAIGLRFFFSTHRFRYRHALIIAWQIEILFLYDGFYQNGCTINGLSLKGLLWSWGKSLSN